MLSIQPIRKGFEIDSRPKVVAGVDLASISQAMIEIVSNSSLREILEYDEVRKIIRYREGIPDSVKKDIVAFINARTVGFV